MKKFLSQSTLLLFALSLGAQDSLKGLFDAKSAAAFFAQDAEAIAQAKEKFLTSAFEEYRANKVSAAAQNLFYHDFLELLDAHAKNAPTAMKEFLLSRMDLIEEFLLILKKEDDMDRVFSILSEIWSAAPEDFKAYPTLALAISIVFDKPPSKDWPHRQVSKEALSRTLPNHVDAFKMWADFRKKGRLLLQTEKLSIEELKFVVSSTTSQEEKEWAQKSVSVNLQNIPRLYGSIVYDDGRINRKAYDWERPDYLLKTIKQFGGICVDQAHYACEVAKARGVPAFILSGAGTGGSSHAWSAYMPRRGAWNFDVGRYEESRFVTGTTIDPQTWKRASCHALESMRENFRSSQKYRENVYRTMFAKRLFNDENYAAAGDAAESAIKCDPRNSESWDVLIDSALKSGKDAKAVDELYARAIRSFSKYPDIDAQYREALMRRNIDSGDDAGARRLSTSIITKTKQGRPDIAMAFAVKELRNDLKVLESKPLLNSYKSLLNSFKSNGIMSYNHISRLFLADLVEAGKFKEAREALKITRQVLKPDETSSLGEVLGRWDTFIAEREAKSN